MSTTAATNGNGAQTDGQNRPSLDPLVIRPESERVVESTKDGFDGRGAGGVFVRGILRLTNDITLILGDCFDYMREWDKADAVITDPQYQLANGRKATTNNATARRGRGQVTKGMAMVAKDWGTMHGDDAPYEPEAILALGVPTVLWGASHYANRLPNVTCWLLWDKREGVPSDDNADGEMAWTNIGGPLRIHRQLWKGVCRRGEENIASAGDKLHPFQKPVALMAWCLNMAKVPEGATVLDPYMGSGSTAIACIRTGRKFIGIERDPVHFETACQRIRRELEECVFEFPKGQDGGERQQALELEPRQTDNHH